jgi:hypothetical protein
MAFSLLRFSPDPEEVEPANVALVLWGGANPVLLFDPEFPRIHCLAPWADADRLQVWMRHLEQILGHSDYDQATKLVRATSAQFALSEPRRLAVSVTPKLLDALIERYLKRPAVPRDKRDPMLVRVEAKLDQLLTERFHVPHSELKRRASPREFLSPDTFARLPGNGFRIARVIDGRSHLMLIDSVPLDAQVSKVEQRAQRIASAFYRLGKIRGDVEQFERRSMHRTTVIFGEIRETTESGRIEYAKQMLSRESDEVVDATHPSQSFGELLREATVDFH